MSAGVLKRVDLASDHELRPDYFLPLRRDKYQVGDNDNVSRCKRVSSRFNAIAKDLIDFCHVLTYHGQPNLIERVVIQEEVSIYNCDNDKIKV